MGGVPGRLRCAGTPPRALIGPFEHLERDGLGASDFDVCLFDSASTGISPPDFPWPLPPVEAGIVPFARVAAGDVCLVRDIVGGAVIAVDRTAAEAIFYVPDAGASGLLEQAALLRDAVQMLLAPRRWLIHAAAVGSGERGALVVGASGSGKSTLALACALSGMGIAGDDYVVLEPGSPPRAHAWNSTAKLTRAGARFLSLDGERTDDWQFKETAEGPAKAVIGLEEVAPGSLRDAVPVTTLIAPRFSDRRTPRLTEVSAGRDMGARSMADVDLLVRPAQAAAAMDCLRGAGWRTELDDPKRMIRVHHSYAFSNPPQGEVDLHWFSLWTTSGDAPLWEAAVPLEIGEEPTLAPCAADSLLNVCAHGSPRQPVPAFRWIADAVTIIRADPPDWDRFVAEARRRRLTVVAAATLAYLREEFSLDVPDKVTASLRAAPAPLWERAAFRAASHERTPWGTLVLIAERHWRMRGLRSEAPWHPDFFTYAASVWDFEHPWQVIAYGARRMGRFGLSRVGLGPPPPGSGSGGARSAL